MKFMKAIAKTIKENWLKIAGIAVIILVLCQNWVLGFMLVLPMYIIWENN